MARYECKRVDVNADGNTIYSYSENGVEIYRDVQVAVYAQISGRLMARCENLENETERLLNVMRQKVA